MGLADAIAGWWIKDDVEEGKRLDEKLGQLNRDAVTRGVWSDEEFKAAEKRRADGSADTYAGGVVADFREGWQEGEQTVVGAVRDTTAAVLGTAGDIVKAPLSGLIRGLPWWAWLLGIVALLAWTGTLPGVAVAVRKAFRK